MHDDKGCQPRSWKLDSLINENLMKFFVFAIYDTLEPMIQHSIVDTAWDILRLGGGFT